MGKMKEYILEQESMNKLLSDDIDDDDIFAGDDSDSDEEIDLYAPVNFDDTAQVLERIFSVVEKYPAGGDSAAWFFFLNDWDRRFVLNIYDMFVTTGKAPLSEKQIKKAKVILRKMMTPSAHQEQ